MDLRVRRRVLWDYLGGALWVFPRVSVVVFLTAGALLSRVSVNTDSLLWPLAFQGTAEDARGILVVVSATMITVTGLVFTLTIVALQIAAGQYSPRLLRNFMRDRGTQVVLSVFVGAFAYSTAGLHTVGIQRAAGEAFVPRLAMSGSLVLGLASVGVLIYFIHHLAHSIQIDTIMSTVEREARWIIDDLYPDQSGYLEREEQCPDPPASAVVVTAGRSGSIQAVQPDSLVRAAARQDLVVRLARQVGDHVVEATPLAWAWPRSAERARLDPQLLQAALGDAVSIGFERTMVQDVPFGLRRLVDIGNKALSPAINDPYTGIQAVHHLSVLLCLLAGRRLGDRLYHDEQGTLRVAVPRRSSPTTCGSAQPRSDGRGRRSRRSHEPHPAVQGCGWPRCERGPAPGLRPPHLAGAGGCQARDRPARGCGGGAGGRGGRAGRAGRRPPPTHRRLNRRQLSNPIHVAEPFQSRHGRRLVATFAAPSRSGSHRTRRALTIPARTLLDILPVVCREAWSAASVLQREEAVDAGGSGPSLRIVTHRRDAAPQDVAMSKLSSMLGRRAWALSVHRLLEAGRHRFPAWWQYLHPSSAFPPLIRRQMVWAGWPALLAIAGLLVDQQQLISAVVLRELRRFLTEPVDSPLVRDDPDTARRSAQALQCSFVGHPEP